MAGRCPGGVYTAAYRRLSGPEVRFSWHGGEPTLLGLDYFRKIVAIQAKYRRPGKNITNGIQTNATLLDEEWCRFFAAEGFTAGVSLDGPAELHDRCRLTGSGGAEPRAGDAGLPPFTAACGTLRYTLRGPRWECRASRRGVPVLQGDRGRVHRVSASRRVCNRRRRLERACPIA